MNNTRLIAAAEDVCGTMDMAEDIARQRFEDPCESTVMALFHRLCMLGDVGDMGDTDDMPAPDPVDEAASAAAEAARRKRMH